MEFSLSLKREAFLHNEIWSKGMGSLVVARQKPAGTIDAGVFLLDVYCLGVKNAFYKIFSNKEFEEKFMPSCFPSGDFLRVELPYARKLIEDSVNYAKSLGFPPNRDYKKALKVLGGIKSSDSEETFTFGSNGRPLFIAGPTDTRQKINMIMKKLALTCGEGNYDYLLPADVC